MTRKEFLSRLASYSGKHSVTENIVTFTPNSNNEHFIKVDLATLGEDKVGVESSFIPEFEDEPTMSPTRFFNFMNEYNCMMNA